MVSISLHADKSFRTHQLSVWTVGLTEESEDWEIMFSAVTEGLRVRVEPRGCIIVWVEPSLSLASDLDSAKFSTKPKRLSSAMMGHEL